MAEPVSVVLLLVRASLKLKSTINLLSENQKIIFALTSLLISETDELANLRNVHAGEHTFELDKCLEDLIMDFKVISSECEALLPKSNTSPIKRTTRWVKTLYTANAVEKKIAKMRERIRDAQHKFLVKNSAFTALDMKYMKQSTSQIRGDINFLVQVAQSDPKEANKIFGIDRMTAEQRKVALHRTTLDLAITTRDERIFLIQLKIRTLKAALETGTPTLYSNSSMETTQGYIPEPHDPFYDVHTEPSKAWSRQDALIETVALLDILQDSQSIATTPAIVWFIRANRLSESLRSLGLRKEALQLCMIAHEVIGKLVESNCSFYQVHYADSLMTVSDCRIDMGDREGALVAIQDCVRIRRALAATKGESPDRNLASSLTKLSSRLCDVGKKTDALSIIQESVGIYRALAKIDPLTFNQDFALSLSILSNNLSNMGKREDALAAIQESVEIRRTLVGTNLDAFNTVLAQSLNDLSIHLSDEGRREDSLAVEIFSELAKTNPAAFTPDLALSLRNLSSELSYTGWTEEALVVTQESVDIYRVLAKLNPDAFNADLAMSLNNLSLRLSDSGKRKEALVSAQEAVVILRDLARTNPDAFDPELAMSLSILSPLLSEEGESKEALIAIQESVDIYRLLFRRYPDYFQPRLAGAFEVLSDCLQALGRVEEAREVDKETRQTL